jgi:galactokinase/mevalonate kinase-like predicted kinase
MGNDDYAVRPYRISDRFDGAEQQRAQFPVLKLNQIESWLKNRQDTDGLHLVSAEQISSQANLHRLFAQRTEFRNENWPVLARNWQHSVFYQLDLDHASRCFAEGGIPLPSPLCDDAPLMTRIHDAMFRGDSKLAFGLLRQSIISQVAATPVTPSLAVCRDQIVWARSPVRIDIAGGWTDTPPYCLIEGGNVVNLAIELNGQPPIQAYVKPSSTYNITLRSIDMGAMEVVSSYDELQQYNKVGSPFSIPKAALALCGFAPQFASQSFHSLEEQLRQFGCGIELTLLSAIPAGSGLGTSSVLAATVLDALSDFCSLTWDKSEICRRTLALEQLLTTGGGWQDQLGGLLGGVKLLESQPGILQQPQARWLPTGLYTQPDYRQCHLLYYTGITRTAKHILSEIVRRMFLNEHYQLLTLRSMKEHAHDMYEAIQRQDFALMGRLVGRTWQQNQQIDSGTNPPAVKAITDIIDDLCLGYKLPGAGGGGYLYMVAKDPEAAGLIKQRLREHAPSDNARFVDMTLSSSGLQVSRS